jgi:hypothetical protein
MKRLLRQTLAAAAAVLAVFSVNAAPPVLRDPALPEALRHTRPAPASEGATLQAQVDAKLRSRFEAADTTGQGHISRAQAEAAGLGFVARHFDAIDSGGHGSVNWAQVQAYIAYRAAAR